MRIKMMRNYEKQKYSFVKKFQNCDRIFNSVKNNKKDLKASRALYS